MDIPVYFFHLRRGKELLEDEHGDDLPDVESAYLHAFTAAREIWTLALTQREDPTTYAFEVTGSKGEFLFNLPVVEVLDAGRRPGKRMTRADIQQILEKNRALRDSLIEQIERTRNSINHTYDLLRTLRQRHN